MSTPLYGAWLDLRGRPCLVVGGGTVATRRVRGLLECAARVRVVAPEVTSDLEDLAADGAIALARRPYEEGDIHGAALVFAATSKRAVNAQVRRDARAAGILTNVADEPADGDFHVAAVVRQGPISLALGTGGLSPAAAAALRAWLASLVTPEHGRAVELLGQARRRPALAPAAQRAARLLAGGDATASVAELRVALDVEDAGRDDAPEP